MKYTQKKNYLTQNKPSVTGAFSNKSDLILN